MRTPVILPPKRTPVIIEPIARVRARLHAVQPEGAGWVALCPAHPDGTPSLAIALGADGKVLLVCRAGCRTDDVVRALGLEWADLFPPRTGQGRHARPAGLSESDHARRDVLAEARRQQAKRAQYAELTADADVGRITDRTVLKARRAATALGPDRDEAWELLAKAAALETGTRSAESASC